MDFISNFLYYNTIGLTFGISGFLFCEYISEPEYFIMNIKNHFNTIKFWTIDKVITFYMIYNDICDKYKTSKKNNQDNKNISVFLLDNGYKLIEYNNKQYYIHKSNILYNNEKLEHNTIQNDLFLGINITINEITYEDVKDNFNKFMIEGVCIDKEFIRIFMKEFYNLENVDNYTIQILDKNCISNTIHEDEVMIIGNNYFIKHKLEIQEEQKDKKINNKKIK